MGLDYQILIVFVWLLVLSFLWIRNFIYFRKLVKKSNGEDLEKLLDKILSQEEKNSINIDKISKKLLEIDEDGKLHLQKLGMVRFNPFKELGGAHSFSLVLMDAKDNGVVITSLHSRERTRVYLKELRGGRSSLELSDEEEKALKIAQKMKIK